MREPIAMNTTRTQWKPGPLEHVTGDRQAAQQARTDRVIAAAAAQHQHLWIAVVGYLMPSPPTGRAILDHENIMGPPAIACFLCEQEWTERIQDQPCPGEQL